MSMPVMLLALALCVVNFKSRRKRVKLYKRIRDDNVRSKYVSLIAFFFTIMRQDDLGKVHHASRHVRRWFDRDGSA